jgi:uncharacterized protein YndB with AHSA1/START domain
MEPKFEVQMKIHKPVDEVFEAVVNPKKLSGYFTKASSGPLEEGATVTWSFPEHAGEYPVKVRQVIKNERIVLEWAAADGGYDTKVVMAFKPLEPSVTMVQISESGWRDTPKGVESSYRNCGGWMHMSCCLKAYLEHGINLRVSKPQ